MNREELIEGLEYTKERYREIPILDSAGLNVSAMCSDVLSVLENCIEIPEGSTNGDFIRTIFPDGIYRTYRDENCTYYLHDNGCLYFSLEWWNAPFKKEVNYEKNNY